MTAALTRDHGSGKLPKKEATLPGAKAEIGTGNADSISSRCGYSPIH